MATINEKHRVEVLDGDEWGNAFGTHHSIKGVEYARRKSDEITLYRYSSASCGVVVAVNLHIGPGENQAWFTPKQAVEIAHALLAAALDAEEA